MGEEKSGKSEAIRKGRERARDVDADAGLNDESVATMSRRASPATDAVGDVKTAYKRGGPRPWEVARAAREAKAATVKKPDQDPDAADAGSAFGRAGLPPHMVEAMGIQILGLLDLLQKLQ